MTDAWQKPRGDELRALIRYAVVGLSSNLLLFLFMLFLMSLGFAAWQATLVVYPSGVAMSYILNRFWSFNKRPQRSGQVLGYIFVYVLAYPIAMGTASLVEYLSGSGPLAALTSIGVSAVFIFTGLSYWVFRKNREQLPRI
jgi:putative flippase GtrA